MTALDLDPDTVVRKTRSWWFAAAAALLLLLAGVIALRSVRDDPSPTSATASTTAEVSFDTVWPPLADAQTRRCTDTDVVYDWAEVRSCIRSFEGEATLSGDIAGSALWAMLANQGTAADPNDDEAAITATFNGTYLVKADVAGCGSGEFMIAEQLRFLGWASGQFVGTWQIIPGSGRGELASITGSGTMPAADTETTRAHTGTISCG